MLRGRYSLLPSSGGSGGSGHSGAGEEIFLDEKIILALTKHAVRPVLIILRDIKEASEALKPWLGPVLAGVADLLLTGVLLELPALLTDVAHLLTEGERETKPASGAEVSVGRRERRLETGHPVTGRQESGAAPPPVPLTAQLLARGVRPVRRDKLSGRPAPVAEVGHVVLGNEVTAPAGVEVILHPVVGGVGGVLQALDDDLPVIRGQTVL